MDGGDLTRPPIGEYTGADFFLHPQTAKRVVLG